MTITRPANTAATFSFIESTPSTTSVLFDYDGLIKISDQPLSKSVAGFHLLQGTLVAEHDKRVEPGRICCQGSCAQCPPLPPCVGKNALRVDGKHVAIDPSVKHLTGARPELAFDRHSDQRVPIFTEGEALLAELTAWHAGAFGASRPVIYHIYKIVDPVTSTTGGGLSALNTTLARHLIAIPIEPRWEPLPADKPQSTST